MLLFGWLCPHGVLAQDSLWQQVYSTETGKAVLSLATDTYGRLLAGTSNSQVIISDDRGILWNSFSLDNDESDSLQGVYALAIDSAGVVYAGTGNKGVYRSNDGGMTWFGTAFVANRVYDLAFNTQGHVLAGGSIWISISEDGGDVWRDVLMSGGPFLEWHFALLPDGDLLTGNAGGNEFCCGELYRSSDGGESWIRLMSWYLPVISLAVNEGNHIFVGTTGNVVRSVDDGASWKGGSTSDGTDMGDVRALIVFDDNRLFAGTSKGVYRSIDNGETWQRYGLDHIETWALALDAEHHLFAGTELGIHRSIAPVQVGREEDVLPSPQSVMLEAAYPNPFNPVTTVPFALPEAARVRLEVFDLMGRRVAVLADGPYEAGRHAVVFAGGGVASGLYLLHAHVTTESGTVHTFTQKLTLVR